MFQVLWKGINLRIMLLFFLFIKVHDKRAHNTPNLSRNLDARNPSQFAFVRQICHL